MLGNKNPPKRFHLNGNTTRFRSLIWKLEWQTSRYLLSYFWIKYRIFSSNSDLFRLQLWGTWIYLFERPCKGQTFSQVEFFEQHSHKKEQRKSRKVSHWRSLQSLKYSITGQRKTGLKRLMCSCFLLQIFSISLPSSFNNPYMYAHAVLCWPRAGSGASFRWQCIWIHDFPVGWFIGDYISTAEREVCSEFPDEYEESSHEVTQNFVEQSHYCFLIAR